MSRCTAKYGLCMKSVFCNLYTSFQKAVPPDIEQNIVYIKHYNSLLVAPLHIRCCTVYFAILFSLQHIMDISCQSNIYAWITKMLFQDYNDTRNQHKLIEPCSLFRWLLLKMNDLCKSREVLICNVRPCADSGWLMAQRWRQRQQLSCRIFCVYFV